MKKEVVVRTLPELEAEAARFMRELVPSDFGATFVPLSGEPGAGKTAFVKAVAHALGIDETVTSPTFVLEKIYQLGSSTSKFKRLVHIDAYRLESGRDLASLGFDELMQDVGNLVMLEWPERVASALPVPAHELAFVVESSGSRTISYG